MARLATNLIAHAWTPELARQVERAALAIGRLDSRAYASPMAKAWRRRASWTGFATALRLQGNELDEIDIFSRECGVALPGRRALMTTHHGSAGPEAWLGAMDRQRTHHWREDLPFSLELPPHWDTSPSLFQVFEVVAQYARAHEGLGAWLAMPHLLRAMAVTRTALPCMVVGSRALRLGSRDPNLPARLLDDLARAAETGLDRLEQLEADRRRAVHAVAAATRPGALIELVARLPNFPVTTPRALANALDLSISGAGKLLSRAADLNLVVEISGRRAWRAYLTPDLARAFGFAAPKRGRPPAVPPLSPGLENLLARFDEEMRAVDDRLATLGIGVPGGLDTALGD